MAKTSLWLMRSCIACYGLWVKCPQRLTWALCALLCPLWFGDTMEPSSAWRKEPLGQLEGCSLAPLPLQPLLPSLWARMWAIWRTVPTWSLPHLWRSACLNCQNKSLLKVLLPSVFYLPNERQTRWEFSVSVRCCKNHVCKYVDDCSCEACKSIEGRHPHQLPLAVVSFIQWSQGFAGQPGWPN